MFHILVSLHLLAISKKRIDTHNNDYYLTSTESKKKFDDNGTQNFEKHKIFLYKEDFDKFSIG